MANEKLKRVWVPAPCDPETSAVLESLLSESRAWVSHGRYGGKRPSNPRFPRIWADAAIDSSANGFLTIPRSEKHVAGTLDLSILHPNLIIHYEVPPNTEILRCICIMKSAGSQTGHWSLGFEARSRPPFRTYTLVPSDGQRKWLHMLFDDMLTWQQYFIRWHRIPTPYKLLPTWAMRRLWRDHGHVWPTTIRALQRLGDTKRYPKGVHVLIFRNPACGERYVDLDPIGRITVDGVIKSRNPVHARVNYCKEEDMFTIQLRDDNDYQD